MRAFVPNFPCGPHVLTLLDWMPSKVCGHFESHKQFRPLDRIGELSIQLAVSNREDCHLKSHNWGWNVRVMRHRNEDYLVLKFIT